MTHGGSWSGHHLADLGRHLQDSFDSGKWKSKWVLDDQD